jgi:predicted aldo/keto reductase-like oxidoreductase
MEPVKGGLLAKPIPSVAQILNEANPHASPSSWAMRFAASLDNVITVLSGMSNIEQMEDNLATMSDFHPLNDAEYAVIERVRDALNAIENIPCTKCRYCVKGCPQEIAIPDILDALNQYLVFGGIETPKGFYDFYTRTAIPPKPVLNAASANQPVPSASALYGN